MKCIFAISLAVLVVLCAGEDEKTFEDMDVEALLNDEGQWKIIYDCLMDKGPCGELQKLRDSIPEMVETKCSNCTPKQKEKFEQTIKILVTKYPKEHQLLKEKYSPKTE